jgi:hypothetical protein
MLLVRWLIHEGRERKEISRNNCNEVQEQSVREKKQWFCSLFHVLCSIVYAISYVFLCLPLSSFFCVEKDLLCSSERCFVYYLKIQATESFEISQKSVHMNIVTNILPLFITIFIFHCHDRPVIFISNSTQISGFSSKKILLSVTVYWTTFIPNTLLVLNFVIPKIMYVFICREIVTSISSGKS